MEIWIDSRQKWFRTRYLQKLNVRVHDRDSCRNIPRYKGSVTVHSYEEDELCLTVPVGAGPCGDVSAAQLHIMYIGSSQHPKTKY